MRSAGLLVAFACACSAGLAVAQTPSGASGSGELLATVRITHAVMAGGKPLPVGTYQVRLTAERPAPQPGQPIEAQRWVELVADRQPVAREIAEVLRDDDLPAVGASSRAVRIGTRVELLKGGEFLRISVKQEGVRYLVYLPVVR